MTTRWHAHLEHMWNRSYLRSNAATHIVYILVPWRFSGYLEQRALNGARALS